LDDAKARYSRRVDALSTTPTNGNAVGRYAGGCATGIAIAAVSLVIIFVGGEAGSSDQSPETAEAMGKLIGPMLVPVIGGSAAAGLAFLYKRWLGALLTAGVLVTALALVGLTFLISSVRGPARARPVTAADRVPPTPETVGGEPMFVQRALGLALPSLADFTYETSDAMVGQVYASQPEIASRMVHWRYSAAEGTQQLLISVGIEAPCSPARQASFFASIIDGARESAASRGVRLVGSQSRGPLDHVLRMYLPASDANVLTRLFAYTYRDAFLLVTVTAVGDPSLEHFADGARWLPD